MPSAEASVGMCGPPRRSPTHGPQGGGPGITRSPENGVGEASSEFTAPAHPPCPGDRVSRRQTPPHRTAAAPRGSGPLPERTGNEVPTAVPTQSMGREADGVICSHPVGCLPHCGSFSQEDEWEKS